MSAPSGKNKASLIAFFLEWAEVKRWDVPAIHVQACHWLENCGDLAVLRCFRGFGKSTLLAVYNAWRYYRDPTHRILHQGADDQMAYKTSRDTQHVLRNHPWTTGMLPDRPGPVEQWWVEGSDDPRNASMFAKGITSTTTSSRADECQNDDVEVPKNISNPEAREKMRNRLGEQVHIMVPGAKQMFIGTPHTHDSLYDEQEKLGADCLTIRMFEREHRIEEAAKTRYAVPFVPDLVFFGIGKSARLLVAGVDYRNTQDGIEFAEPPMGLVDCYAGCAWPERFDHAELLKRRRKTRTINEWDSQYQLHSKPVGEQRLNPERMVAYNAEPVIRHANGETLLMLGDVRIVGCKARWDCSLGKIKSDASAVSVVFTDEVGRLYWHRAEAMTGELEEFDDDGRTLIGGQIKQLLDLLTPLQVPSITIETNGPGGFLVPIARKHLKRYGIAVTPDFERENKQQRILDAFEPPLSSGFLWAHVSVIDGPAGKQMADFDPMQRNQPDDYIDSAAGAISATPVRVGRVIGQVSGNPNGKGREDWRPGSGVHEVELEA
jgi:hypothetical protein